MTCKRSVDITSKHLQPIVNDLSLIWQNCSSFTHLPPSQSLTLEQQCSLAHRYTVSFTCRHKRPRDSVNRAKRASDFQLQCRRYVSSSAKKHNPKSLNSQKPIQPPLRSPPPPGPLSPRSFAPPPPRPTSSSLNDSAIFEVTIARTSDEIAYEIANRDAIRIAKQRDRLLQEQRLKQAIQECQLRAKKLDLFHIGANVDVRRFVRQELEKARNEARAILNQRRARRQRKFDELLRKIEEVAGVLEAIPNETQIKLKEARDEGKRQYRLQHLWEIHCKTSLQPVALRIEESAKHVQTLQKEFLDTKFDAEMRSWNDQKVALQASAAIRIDALLKHKVTGMHMTLRQLSVDLEVEVATLKKQLEKYDVDVLSKYQHYSKYRTSAWNISTGFSRLEDITRSLTVVSHFWRNANLYRNIQTRSPAATSMDLQHNKTRILTDKLEDSTASLREHLNDFARLRQWKEGKIQLIQKEEQVRWQLRATRYEKLYGQIRSIMDDTRRLKRMSKLMHAGMLNFVPRNPLDQVLASVVRPLRQYVGMMHETAQEVRDYCDRDDLLPWIRMSSSCAEIHRISGEWLYNDRRDLLRYISILHFAMAANLQLNPALLAKTDLRFAELRAVKWQELLALAPKSGDLAMQRSHPAHISLDLTYELDDDDYDCRMERSARNVGERKADVSKSVMKISASSRITSKPSKTVTKSWKLISKPLKVTPRPFRVISRLPRTVFKSLRITQNIAPKRRSRKQTWPAKKLNPKSSKVEKPVKRGRRSRQGGVSERARKTTEASDDVGKVIRPAEKFTKSFAGIRKWFVSR